MITGHITNYAKRRDVEIEVLAAGEVDDDSQVWFYTSYNDCEPVLMYIVNDDGTLTYRSKLMKTLEDLPAHISNKEVLKRVICYISDQHKADIM